MIHLILVLMLSFSLEAGSLMDKMIAMESASPAVKRLYLQNKLRHVSEKYMQWLSGISEEEFMAHLRVSYFGSILYAYLGQNMLDPSQVSVRSIYMDLIARQFAQMRNTLSEYTKSSVYDPGIFARVKPYIDAYSREFEAMMKGNHTVAAFQMKEQEITQSLMQAAMDPLTREMLQILVFLEFQVMEYGLS
ncbi:MAG: hypothetical protein H3C47_05850 [Candidatus Cloacimonetes bacterium]|nr:hypothetical protein [Candidatus Cloacimonadota bacterium]